MDADVTAARLTELRKRSGKSLKAIGDFVGVNKSTVMRWENGTTRNISLPDLRKLSQCYNVSIAYLLGEEEKSGGGGRTIPPFASAAEALPPDEIELLSLYRRLLPNEKTLALKIIKNISSEDK